MRISEWSSDVCSSDLGAAQRRSGLPGKRLGVVDDLQSALFAQHIERVHQSPGRQVILALGVQALGHCPLHATAGGQRQQRAAASKHSTIRHARLPHRSEEHTSELQSLMRTSYAVFRLKKKTDKIITCIASRQSG